MINWLYFVFFINCSGFCDNIHSFRIERRCHDQSHQELNLFPISRYITANPARCLKEIGENDLEILDNLSTGCMNSLSAERTVFARFDKNLEPTQQPPSWLSIMTWTIVLGHLNLSHGRCCRICGESGEVEHPHPVYDPKYHSPIHTDFILFAALTYSLNNRFPKLP